MSQVIRTEHYLETPELPKLFLQSWKKDGGGQRGLFFITHGISEHSDCYDALASEMAQAEWTVFAWDLKGHGRSEGPRGYIDQFADFQEDLATVLQILKNDEGIKATPLVLFGHSMGGLITSQYLLRGPSIVPQACVLSCPAYGLISPLAPSKESAAQWIQRALPTFTVNNGLKFDHLSRDPQMVKSYQGDSLRHRKISASLYLGMIATMDEVLREAHRLPCPLMMQSAGKDTVIDSAACLRVYKEITAPKKLHIYEDSFHEIYNDINRAEVIGHLQSYLGDLGL